MSNIWKKKKWCFQPFRVLDSSFSFRNTFRVVDSSDLLNGMASLREQIAKLSSTLPEFKDPEDYFEDGKCIG